MPAKTDYIKYLGSEELLNAQLTGLFRSRGFDRYRMGRFESYDIYRRHKDYLEEGSIITLPGPDGRPIALRPDVTLSLINNLPAGEGERRFFYDESVFRRDREGEYRELRQLGAECVGGDGSGPECEIAALALGALSLIGGETVLALGHTDAVNAALDEAGLIAEARGKALAFIGNKAFYELKALLGERYGAVESLVKVEGDADEAIRTLSSLTTAGAKTAAGELGELMKSIKREGSAAKVRIDMSLVDDPRYYNGVVMRGYLRGAAGAVLRGGRYDNMLRRMGRNERAVGFALDFGAVAACKAKEVR